MPRSLQLRTYYRYIIPVEESLRGRIFGLVGIGRRGKKFCNEGMAMPNTARKRIASLVAPSVLGRLG
jgi:hypothetical protein